MKVLPIKFKLSDGFLLEEIRDGYHVSAVTKRIWAIELDMLSEFFDVCKRNNIHAFLAYGTLLGAVRHKGFIPWDDDVDVYMDRKNFKKLLKIGANEFKYPYFLQTAYSDRKFFCPYARLRNSLTTGIITGQNSPDYNNGIYIDIFVLDGYVKSKIAYRIQRKIEAVIYVLLFQGLTVKPWIRLVATVAKKCVPYGLAIRVHAFVISFFEHLTDRISILTHGVDRAEPNLHFREDLEESIELPFENLSFPAPKAYDRILKRLYGDYMKFPPVEERGKWHEDQLKFDPDTPYKEYFKRKGIV